MRQREVQCIKSDGKDHKCTKDDECKSTATAATANSAATKGATCSKDGVCEAKAVAAKEDPVKAHFDSRTPASYGCPMEYASQTLYALFLISALSWLSTDLRKAPSLAGKMGELYTSLLQARNSARNSARDSARSSLTPRSHPPPQPTYLKIDCAYAKAMLQIYMFTTVVFGVMSIAYGLGGKWWWQSLASASAADALSSGRKSDFAAILTSRVLGAAHLLVMGAPSGVAAGALAGTPVPYMPPAPARAGARPRPPPTASTPAPWRTRVLDEPPSDAPPADATPPQQGWPLALLQLAEQLASDAAASVALVPAAAPVPRSRAPAVVPTLSPTNATWQARAACVAG